MRNYLLMILLLLPAASFGAEIPLLTSVNTETGTELTTNYRVLLLMTVLGFLPALVVALSPFTRIYIVLSLLRLALGTQQTPGNRVLVGVALLMSGFIMQPVLKDMNENALQPYIQGQITDQEALDGIQAPLRKFLMDQTRKQDVDDFLAITGTVVSDQDEIPFLHLAAAFIVSELQSAFQIGLVLFVPFLIIDLVVASTLMSMGMMMVSPMIFSIPFKIALFTLVSGWSLLVQGLSQSYYF
ncbi:flagellar type III secretion system pore protein FliP [Ferrimonas marina]|uniref:Flagellar biosynthetic protein FliP n=1 Tax=Ferrimonas marina TaxID=299255 RepID=A0A1M5TH14_9GAMM|nr:flagellar type III secretion system pore protein FliP [Ferrimonas marina]SHH49643.1 flagellar biosynthetic protein FliP [Ferrimonas marina]